MDFESSNRFNTTDSMICSKACWLSTPIFKLDMHVQMQVIVWFDFIWWCSFHYLNYSSTNRIFHVQFYIFLVLLSEYVCIPAQHDGYCDLPHRGIWVSITPGQQYTNIHPVTLLSLLPSSIVCSLQTLGRIKQNAP